MNNQSMRSCFIILLLLWGCTLHATERYKLTLYKFAPNAALESIQSEWSTLDSDTFQERLKQLNVVYSITMVVGLNDPATFEIRSETFQIPKYEYDQATGKVTQNGYEERFTGKAMTTTVAKSEYDGIFRVEIDFKDFSRIDQSADLNPDEIPSLISDGIMGNVLVKPEKPLPLSMQCKTGQAVILLVKQQVYLVPET